MVMNMKMRSALTSMLHAPEALREILQSNITLKEPLLVMGQSALLFAASIYDEELAILMFHNRHQIPIECNAADNQGFTALHYAIEADMTDLLQELLLCEGVDMECCTEDIPLPMQKGKVESGGLPQEAQVGF